MFYEKILDRVLGSFDVVIARFGLISHSYLNINEFINSLQRAVLHLDVVKIQSHNNLCLFQGSFSSNICAFLE